MPPIRKCSSDCPNENRNRDLTWSCFACQSPIHLLCYEVMKKTEDIFLIDNITMVCDECLAKPKDDSSPKRRKQPNMTQRTLDVLNSSMVLSQQTTVTATPPKSSTVKQSQ